MRDKVGVWGEQIQTTTYKIDKQQGPTVCSIGNYIFNNHDEINHDGEAY